MRPDPVSPSEIRVGEHRGTARHLAKRPGIRLATFEDYEQIAMVEARHGLKIRPRVQWLSLWLDNPAYHQLPNWPIGWVVEDENRNIAGSLGNVPAFCFLGGKRYVCAAGRGWAVDVKYRALSVMLLAYQLRQRDADMNVVTTPSTTTAALCTQLGWCRVPVGQWDTSGFWITNYAKAVQDYLHAKTPKFISTVVNTLLSPPLRLKDALGRRPLAIRADHQLEWAAGFDSRFDCLWREFIGKHPGLFLADRNCATLRWHYTNALETGRVWILTASAGGRLTAFAVFERREIPALGLSRMLLVDFLSLAKDARLAAAMINHALDRCRAEGIHILETVGSWMEKLHSIQPPPHRRSLDVWSYLYRITNPELERALDDSSWYPTQFDGDASL